MQKSLLFCLQSALKTLLRKQTGWYFMSWVAHLQNSWLRDVEGQGCGAEVHRTYQPDRQTIAAQGALGWESCTSLPRSYPSLGTRLCLVLGTKWRDS